MQKLTAAETKKRVFSVEGFNISLKATGKKHIKGHLHVRKRSDGDLTVAQWLCERFPDAEELRVEVLFGNNESAKGQHKLKSVRDTYPPQLKEMALDKVHAEKLAKTKDMEVQRTNERADQAQKKAERDKQQLEEKVKQVMDATYIGAFAVIEEILTGEVLHPRVRELCEQGVKDCRGEGDTTKLLRQILLAWSMTEQTFGPKRAA